VARDQYTQTTGSNQQIKEYVDGESPDSGDEVQTDNPENGITLVGDEYDRSKFALLNDLEFTELLSSIEGVGINEFFIIYEELKDKIPGGTLDVMISIDGSPDDVLNLLRDAVGYIRKGDAEQATKTLVKIKNQTQKLSDVLLNATSNSHAYLVEKSSKYVAELNKKFKAIFDYLLLLIDQNISLTEEVAALKEEVEDLKDKNEELTNRLRKLLSPEPSGFHVTPELLTIETMGGYMIFQPGKEYQIVVCGSEGVTSALPGRGFETEFTIRKPTIEGSTIWSITPHETLRGKTAYVTFRDTVGGDTIVGLENVVFSFDAQQAGLFTAPSEVTVHYLATQYRNDPDAWAWFNERYSEWVVFKTRNGIGPFSVEIEPPGEYFYRVEYDISSLGPDAAFKVIALNPGWAPQTLRIRSSDAQEVFVSVRVTGVTPYSTPPPPPPPPPDILSVDTPTANIEFLNSSIRQYDWAWKRFDRNRETTILTVNNVVPQFFTSPGVVTCALISEQLSGNNIYEVVQETFEGQTYFRHLKEAQELTPGTMQIYLRALGPGSAPQSLRLKDTRGEILVGVSVADVRTALPPEMYPIVTLNDVEHLRVMFLDIGNTQRIQIKARKVGPKHTEITRVGVQEWALPGDQFGFHWEWEMDSHEVSTELGLDGLPLYESQWVNLTCTKKGSWELAIFGGPPYQGTYGGNALLSLTTEKW